MPVFAFPENPPEQKTLITVSGSVAEKFRTRCFYNAAESASADGTVPHIVSPRRMLRVAVH